MCVSELSLHAPKNWWGNTRSFSTEPSNVNVKKRKKERERESGREILMKPNKKRKESSRDKMMG